MSDNPSCTRYDLRMIRNAPSYWGVNDDGTADLDDYQGEGSADEDGCFDSYYCAYCGTFFTQVEERNDAWQAALDHLKH